MCICQVFKRDAELTPAPDQDLEDPSGLAFWNQCANKTGENDSCQNDVAIVYGKKTTYIVCIFAETNEYNGVNGIRSLSSKIYKALNS